MVYVRVCMDLQERPLHPTNSSIYTQIALLVTSNCSIGYLLANPCEHTISRYGKETKKEIAFQEDDESVFYRVIK